MKTYTGTVVSTQMAKTVIIETQWVRQHPQYKKILRRTTRIAADTNNHTVSVGDVVKVRHVRPISKTKHFVIESVIKKTT